MTQAANDSEPLAPAVGRIAARLGHKPQRLMAITPIAEASKPWRSWEWITSPVCAKATMKKTAPAPDGSPPEVFVYDPEQDH